MERTMKKRLLARRVLLIGVTAVFGGFLVVLVVPGAAAIFFPRYGQQCEIDKYRFDKDKAALRKVLGIDEDQKKASNASERNGLSIRKTSEKSSLSFLQGPFMVPNESVRAPYEGDSQDPIDLVNYEINCTFPPFSIINKDSRQDIGDPPAALPAYCHALKQGSMAVGNSDRGTGILPLESVGALKVRHGQSTSIEVWGSGFMIADHIFATSCHVLEPLFIKDPNDPDHKPLPNEKGKFVIDDKIFTLTVDFGLVYGNYITAQTDSSNEFPVAYLDCSQQDGVDVAFFTVSDKTVEKKVATPPNPVILYYDKLDALTAKPAVLVTYIDLLHPLDAVTAEMYQCFADPLACKPKKEYPNPKPAYGKFAMIDGIIDVQRCSGLDLLLDTADTSVGSSGALVVDIFKSVDLFQIRKNPLAVGLHKCCADFFEQENGYGSENGPPPSIKCAKFQRTPVNQDVTTVSIINDPTLCKYLAANKAKKSDNDDNVSYVSCSQL
jgi:hypothetical protein